MEPPLHITQHKRFALQFPNEMSTLSLVFDVKVLTFIRERSYYARIISTQFWDTTKAKTKND